MYVRFKKLTPTAKAPTQGSAEAAGYDLYADTQEDVYIEPGESKIIDTNIAVELPPGYFGGVYPRSGLSTNRGLTLINCVGVIDSDYRGAIRVPLINLSNHIQVIKPGERVAQLIIQVHARITWTEVDDLSDTGRGAGGFGSTGRT